jgi:phosphoribosyl-ATP pyrophosphohydrolase
LSDGDEHWKAETADIIIHGLMLLARRGVPAAAIDALLDRRLGRFNEKITSALAARQGRE